MQETFKDIEGYEGFYQVSNFGRVKSLERNILKSNNREHLVSEKILKPGLAKMGYYTVALCGRNCLKKKSHYLHKLIAQTFISNPDMYKEINHINGKKDDNRLENLEWCNRSQNVQHAFDNNLTNRTREPQKKLNEKQIRVIKHCINLGMRTKDIAKCFLISASNVTNIKYKRNWKHIIVK